MLEVRGLNASYGASHVLFGLDLEMRAGETAALVGLNGAGKTTTLLSIMGAGGVTRSGSIKIAGVETIGMTAERIARLGVALVPEGRRVFESLTVEENLLAARPGRWLRGGRRRRDGMAVRTNIVDAYRYPGAAQACMDAWPLERVWEMFPLLAKVRRSKGAWLSGGEQQALAIARALVSEPRLLLLDEPGEGLGPRVTASLVDQLRAIAEMGMAVLVAGPGSEPVEALAGHIWTLEHGKIRRGDVKEPVPG